mmetsp:Transcript_3862/g.8273  ORF Transcript_3862/g.8273 Transcript_3862/m.8273 type:complete len:161 (+) Transcript_3862:127-609(+)
MVAIHMGMQGGPTDHYHALCSLVPAESMPSSACKSLQGADHMLHVSYFKGQGGYMIRSSQPLLHPTARSPLAGSTQHALQPHGLLPAATRRPSLIVAPAGPCLPPSPPVPPAAQAPGPPGSGMPAACCATPADPRSPAAAPGPAAWRALRGRSAWGRRAW